MGEANKPVGTANAVNKRKAALNAAHKAKTRKVVITIAAVVVALAILVPLGMIANGSIFRLINVAKVGNEKFSVVDYNYFYNTAYMNTYSEISSTYGDYASYILDGQKPLDEQNYSEEETWAEHFEETALNSMKEAAMLYDEAQKEGFTLSEEQKAELEASKESVKTAASLYGFSLNGYLNAMYGNGMNRKTFDRCMDLSYTAQCYAQSVQDGMTYTQDELQAEYEKDTSLYDTVDFNYYMVKVDSEAEDKDAAKADAKKVADKMVAEVKDSAAFEKFVRENCAESEQETYAEDGSTLQRYKTKSYVSSADYGEWLFDSARKAGDMQAFETDSGYQVVLFVAREDTHYNTVDVRHILITPEAAEGAEEVTDADWKAAKEKAEGLLEQWKSGDATEDSFAALVAENSDDTGSKDNGGLYADVYKGQMVDEFNDWCFDKARKSGDTAIVETDYGYHVMYFVGECEEYWTMQLTSAMKSAAYTAWETEKLEGYTLDVNESTLKYGRHD